MKALVIGLGSIGKRVSRLLINEFNIEVFALRQSLKSDFNSDNSPLFSQGTSWKEVESFKPDMAFICNPTNLHIKTAFECIERNLPILIEKPIDVSMNQLNELIKLCEKNQVSTYIAYLLRFHPCIKFLKSYLNISDIDSVSCFCESYLPSWRDSNHLNTYSSHKDQGGGVILDLSHEFDYIDYLFGPITCLEGDFGRKENITVDSEDYVNATMVCNQVKIKLHMNYFTKEARRGLEIKLKNGQRLIVNLLTGHIKDENSSILNEKVDIDSIYHEQLSYFINNLTNTRMMNNIIEARELFEKLITFKNGDLKK